MRMNRRRFTSSALLLGLTSSLIKSEDEVEGQERGIPLDVARINSEFKATHGVYPTILLYEMDYSVDKPNKRIHALFNEGRHKALPIRGNVVICEYEWVWTRYINKNHYASYVGLNKKNKRMYFNGEGDEVILVGQTIVYAVWQAAGTDFYLGEYEGEHFKKGVW